MSDKFNSPNFANISNAVWGDFTIPDKAMEVRNVTTASVKIFSSSLNAGIPYALFSDGATVYFTLEGTYPSMSLGTSNAGIPVGNGERFYFNAPHNSMTLICAVTNSQSSIVTLYRGVASSSISPNDALTQGITP